MAILNTLRGTVASDPMRVPAPAAMSTGRKDSFASALDEATAPPRERLTAKPEPAADVDDEIAATTPSIESDEGDSGAVENAPEDVDPTTTTLRAAHQGSRADTDVTIETPRRGDGGKQATAGKGPHSPGGSSTPVTSEPLLSELIERSARNPQPGTITIATTAAAQVAGRTAGEPMLRAVDGTDARGSTTPRAARVTPGYRTSAKVSAQMLDQARESVFKQILLKLTDGGGEMRMRLDPPELGELDMRLVVEGGNRLSLSINAERADLADLIQKHVAELSRTLASAGLELTHTDVQSRGAGAGRENFGDADRPFGDSDDDSDNFKRQQSGGYIRADGLDFWV